VKTRRGIVRGRVQGVGYRFFAQRAARDLEVRGWVRNLADGTVETVAQGDEEALSRYFERLRQGPRGSRVEAVLEEEASVETFSSFEITG
jgi:acylphosphatase